MSAYTSNVPISVINHIKFNERANRVITQGTELNIPTSPVLETKIVETQICQTYKGTNPLVDFPIELYKAHSKYHASNLQANIIRNISDLFDQQGKALLLDGEFSIIKALLENNIDYNNTSNISHAIEDFTQKANKVYNNIKEKKDDIEKQIKQMEQEIYKINKDSTNSLENQIKMIQANKRSPMISGLYSQLSNSIFSLSSYVGINMANDIRTSSTIEMRLTQDTEYKAQDSTKQENKQDNFIQNSNTKTLYGKLAALIDLKSWINEFQNKFQNNIANIKIHINTLLAKKFINESKLTLKQAWDQLETIGWLECKIPNQSNDSDNTENILKYVNKNTRDDKSILTNTDAKQEFQIYDIETDKVIIQSNNQNINKITLTNVALTPNTTYEEILDVTQTKITLTEDLLGLVELAKEKQRMQQQDLKIFSDVAHQRKEMIKNIMHATRIKAQEDLKILMHWLTIERQIVNMMFKAYEPN